EYGQNEFLKRISDPYWFQAFSCVLGFDWHSSGTTTTTCGALKMALNPGEHGIMVAGGKGKTSRKTPQEIQKTADIFSLSSAKIDKLIHSSRMSAKIDNSCIQDNYSLYHHVFIFTEKGDWAVVQQGMGEKYARRYHWLSENINTKKFIDEPHTGICCDLKNDEVLDMTAHNSRETREVSVDLINDNPDHLKRYFRNFNKIHSQKTLLNYNYEEFTMPRHHPVLDIDLTKQDVSVLQKAYEIQPKNYEELISLKGMGPKKIRALALISDLVYGSEPSWKDPVKYSFTHGGKDGFPYPVNRKVYDHSIQTLKNAVEGAKLNKKDKYFAIKKLQEFL
ncbi:MAG: DUF763 domain-containing protein, partial [Candidatus Altiarchaeales archaeon HGW-Altiarchaeales-3]